MGSYFVIASNPAAPMLFGYVCLSEKALRKEAYFLSDFSKPVFKPLNSCRHLKHGLLCATGFRQKTVPLGSMTLGLDDVDIAARWMKNYYGGNDDAEISKYHEEFKAWNGSRHAFSFMGGRVAFSSIIYALGLRHGDEIVIPAFTCIVVPNACEFAGLKVVYSDIELETFGLDVARIESKLTPKTKAIVVHHLFGLVCRDFEALLTLAKKFNLRVIEDCCHSAGAEYKGKKVGNWGDAAFYSSEQSKIFNTVQGGLAVTNDDKIAAGLAEFYGKATFPNSNRINQLLKNCALLYYQNAGRHKWISGTWNLSRLEKWRLESTTPEEIEGRRPTHYGQKMPAPLAAIGRNQLRKIDAYNKKRRHAASHWNEWCRINGYSTPSVIPESTPVFLRYPVLVEQEKKRNLAWTTHIGVQVGVWFVSHIHPAPKELFGYSNADLAVKKCINLPCILDW